MNHHIDVEYTDADVIDAAKEDPVCGVSVMVHEDSYEVLAIFDSIQEAEAYKRTWRVVHDVHNVRAIHAWEFEAFRKTFHAHAA